MIEEINIVKKKRQRENKGVKKDIETWINNNLLEGEYVMYKNWGGGIYGKAGRPDIEIAYRGLVNYWELKDENGILSTLQIEVINAYAKAGIKIHVAMSVEDFKKDWKKIYEMY